MTGLEGGESGRGKMDGPFPKAVLVLKHSSLGGWAGFCSLYSQFFSDGMDWMGG